MTAPPALLLTRPQPQSERFATQYRAQAGKSGAVGPIVIAPMQKIVPLPGALDLAGVTGLVFTSETAVQQFVARAGAPDLPVWCVGPRSCRVARDLGFGTVVDGGGDARSLVARIARDAPKGTLLHPSGHHKAADLPQMLAQVGVRLCQTVVYDQRAVSLAASGRRLLQGSSPVLVPVFSPRSARLLHPEIAAATAPLSLVALSPAVADALAFPAVIVARPNGEAMLEMLIDLRRGLMCP